MCVCVCEGGKTRESGRRGRGFTDSPMLFLSQAESLLVGKFLYSDRGNVDIAFKHTFVVKKNLTLLILLLCL